MANFIERALIACRYLLLPLYFGLALLLLLVIANFSIHFVEIAKHVLAMSETEMIFSVLSAVDQVLIASLIVMVMLSGYASFVGGLDLGEGETHLAWLGKLDQGSLKVKIAVSIVTIASIRLLSAFMEIDEVGETKLLWFVAIHLTLVATAIALTLIDRIAVKH